MPLTNGSGSRSRGPTKIRIRRIRIRIRIRNTTCVQMLDERHGEQTVQAEDQGQALNTLIKGIVLPFELVG
jgi:hypothetical protein